MTVNRRTVIKGALAAGVASQVLEVRPRSAQAGPIRVGLLTIRTGALASGGNQMERGLVLFLKERNNTLAGRKVELVVADSGGEPAGARTKTQELVERNGCTSCRPARRVRGDRDRRLHPPAQNADRCWSAAAEDMTQRKANPWFARATATPPSRTTPSAIRREKPRVQARR